MLRVEELMTNLLFLFLLPFVGGEERGKLGEGGRRRKSEARKEGRKVRKGESKKPGKLETCNGEGSENYNSL